MRHRRRSIYREPIITVESVLGMIMIISSVFMLGWMFWLVAKADCKTPPRKPTLIHSLIQEAGGCK